MKRFISRRSFLKTAGVTTAAAAVAVGAPSASACFGKGKLPEITISTVAKDCDTSKSILTSTTNPQS